MQALSRLTEAIQNGLDANFIALCRAKASLTRRLTPLLSLADSPPGPRSMSCQSTPSTEGVRRCRCQQSFDIPSREVSH